MNVGADAHSLMRTSSYICAPSHAGVMGLGEVNVVCGGMECHEQQQEYLTLCPAAPPGDVTLVVAVDAAGRVVELEVAGGGHAHHVNVLKRK